MEDILIDNKAFKKVSFDDNIGNLQKFQQFLYRLKKNNSLYQSLRSTAAPTPTLYGLAKLHKNEIPLRSILASIGSFTNKPAKWLSEKLASLRNHPTSLMTALSLKTKLKKLTIFIIKHSS